MNRPTLFVPQETLKLYSQKKPITIRPYLVGEEKLLLMAQQAQQQDKNTKEVEKAVRQIITACTDGAVDANTLPIFDVTYLFLKLRAISMNNVIEAQFRCKNLVDEKLCNTLVKIAIDINQIEITVPPNHSNRVQLTDTMGITLKYPTAAIYDVGTRGDLATVLSQCMDTIFDTSGTVWEMSDWAPTEIETFVNGMTLAHVDKIRTTFFETMPHLAYSFTFLCPKCSYTEPVVLRELEDFFG
jgi:hypothetical protein